MSECKHGLKQGCFYCHGRTTAAVVQAEQKKRPKASRLSEKMNERMTTLKQRLKELRGQ
jgi:histone acetyltransferase (RNA polymerase elongator complex component)